MSAFFFFFFLITLPPPHLRHVSTTTSAPSVYVFPLESGEGRAALAMALAARAFCCSLEEETVERGRVGGWGGL